MKKVDNDFLNVMTLNDIRAKVNSCKPGTFHSILMIDGAPETLSADQTLYIIETLRVVFGVNYYNRSYKKVEQMITLASTPSEVEMVKDIYDNYKHKELILKSSVAELDKKVQAMKDGNPIPQTTAVARNTAPKVRDTICPAIVYNNNGSITLSAVPSFQHTIKSVKGGFEYQLVSSRKRFFLKTKEGVYELEPSEYAPFEKVAIAAARAAVKKKSSGPASFYAPKVTNIIKII